MSVDKVSVIITTVLSFAKQVRNKVSLNTSKILMICRMKSGTDLVSGLSTVRIHIRYTLDVHIRNQLIHHNNNKSEQFYCLKTTMITTITTSFMYNLF